MKNNKALHGAVLELLFADIISTEQANEFHKKIDKIII